jgi:hypothetical protein
MLLFLVSALLIWPLENMPHNPAALAYENLISQLTTLSLGWQVMISDTNGDNIGRSY